MSTVTVVATVEPNTVPPRVRLNVTDTGSTPTFLTTVVRVGPDGGRVPVRTYDGNPLQLTTSGSTRVGLLYDYEAPFGVSVSYSTVQTPASVTAAVTVTSSQAWLIHPGIPALSMPVVIAGLAARAHKVTSGVLYPMGRATPVVQTDGVRKAPEFSLSLSTSSDDERDDLQTLIDDAGVLLLNVPADKGWGIDPQYVAVGDVTETPLTRLLADPWRTWTLPCTVVDSPIGGQQAARTLDTLSSFATLDAIGAAYSTLNAVNAGP